MFSRKSLAEIRNAALHGKPMPDKTRREAEALFTALESGCFWPEMFTVDVDDIARLLLNRGIQILHGADRIDDKEYYKLRDMLGHYFPDGELEKEDD